MYTAKTTHAPHEARPAKTHHAMGKATGKTAHIERWNITLRQRLARYVRITFSFSTPDVDRGIVVEDVFPNFRAKVRTAVKLACGLTLPTRGLRAA